MESPASTVRRRAWINSSRQWLTLEELDPEGPPCSLPSASLADDDVFSDESALKAKHFDDELSLGADEDAEETLYELGFGSDEPQVTVRIPSRFFTFPSLAQGINFRLFLDSQLRRIREEDPSLSLASRFRQVQVLTAMANAFYSLYSHVSRTPLQKLATPEFSFSSSPVERIERFRSSVRSEPRSPVERLKDTVSKMCLYTGSPRGSDSTSPQTSPRKRSSLPDVVGIVLEKAKTGVTKTLDMGGFNRSNSAVDITLVTDGDEPCNSGEKEQAQQTVVDTDPHENVDKICYKEIQGGTQTDNVDADESGGKPEDLESRTHCARTSLVSSLSGETVIETAHQIASSQPELDLCSAQSDTRTANLKPVAKVTFDIICPQIVESTHQELFCTHSAKTNPPISPETEHVDRPCPESHMQTAASEPDSHTGVSRSPPVMAPDGCFAQCCITVTVGDDVSSSSLNAPDSSLLTSAVPTIQTREGNQGKSQYLNPLMHQGLGSVSSNLQQVNSFELEEVHSAGEEDFGQSETTRTTSLFSKEHQYKGEVVRGDSMQSDSSGYADEEFSLSSSAHSR
ncbi:Protein TESPA1 [Nibea albiflora]|uniref:Protein TESPA1 n=1 Tax=Nibea albiflora TaxID=240163 RepID=A0ACB7F0J2_NIBAL|nr:Protein TESPA1 [Nibea albiflora]